MNPEALRKLQLLELKILIEVKRICDMHNIKYFLIGGSLLGAVRHQGFIPWDDDIDIGMFREDYDKFVRLCDSYLQDSFFLQTSDTDAGLGGVFGKVRLNGTEFYPCEQYIKNHGIYIDIFPFDKVPDNKYLQKVQSFSFFVIDGAYHKLLGYEFPHEKGLKDSLYLFLISVMSFLLPKRLLKSTREYIIRYYNNKKTTLMRNWPFKTTPISYFEKTLSMEFETLYFPVPKYYDEYLTLFYGDYMCIPPDSERIVHTIYEPDFGKYSYIKTLDDVLPKKE